MDDSVCVWISVAIFMAVVMAFLCAGVISIIKERKDGKHGRSGKGDTNRK